MDECADRSAQEPGIEEDGLGLGMLAGRPEDAVPAVQLGRQRPAGDGAVEPLLEPPRGELTVAVETLAEAGVPENVVHTAEPVEGAAGIVAHHGVPAIGSLSPRS